MLDLTYDAIAASQFGVVCGTDEAGRGPLAGPVVAAAVVAAAYRMLFFI